MSRVQHAASPPQRWLRAIRAVAVMAIGARPSGRRRSCHTWAALLSLPLAWWSVLAPASAGEDQTLDRVTLQLKWTHAFQFAGYYAALEKGYYREAGLDVLIVEAMPGDDPVQDVVAGQAQYGVGTSSLLLARKAGKPVVALAVIFQHSPYVLIARHESATQGVHDLIGKRIMMEPQSDELLAYLMAEEIPPERIVRVEHSYDPQDLIDGRVDAIAGYVTNQPYFLDRAHFAYQVHTPRSAGIDFYGDNLFTTESELRAHPARVKAFRAASLHGWQYAMEHPEEIVDLILAQYSRRHSREYFLFEARQMVPLLCPELIEIGYMHPGRWRHIAETYAELGMLEPGFNLKGFLYDPNPPPADLTWLYLLLGAVALVLAALVSVVTYIYRINARLRQEVAERTQAEEAARQAEADSRSCFELPLHGIAITSPDKGWIRVNDCLCSILGRSREEITRMTWAEMTHPDDLAADVAQFERLLAGQIEQYRMEKRFVRKDGTVAWTTISVGCVRQPDGKADHIVCAVADNTERKQAEAEMAILQSQLQQAQKMETVGRLAGGVAHEFNNQLMGIMNYADLCRDELPPDHAVCAFLDEINDAAQRSADIAKQLLAFARKQVITPTVLDLNDALAGMLGMLRRLLGEDVDLVWLPGAELWPVRMDLGQVNQVLLNLCVNARDAIAGVGQITIETRNTTLDQSHCAVAGTAPGDYVLLALSDNGCGMSKDVLDHLFEPFFTTKEVGKGTGLGLATVYGIINQNAGGIGVDSRPGAGTVFRLYLPRAEPEAGPEPLASVSPLELPRGTEMVLLAEDERSVRVTTQRLLEQLGYAVLVATSPEEALRLADSHAGSIDLLITDVVMPGMNGPDLAEELALRRPESKRLFMSGYTASATMERGGLDTDAPFLSKPFSRRDLALKVREVLDA